MFNYSSKKFILLLMLAFFVGAGFFIFINNPAESSSRDAIAIRVFPNPDHLSALDWYKKQNFSGSPQSMQVDGYGAVRDGQSVYVNVANISGINLYTNIYLITFNLEADDKTADIFGEILRNWKFNSNIIGSGFCRSDNAKPCVYDSDCSISDHCDSEKSRVIRDTKRLADLAHLNITIEKYREERGFYPKLQSGSYLPGKTLSVWPSWNSTFSSELKRPMPLDPVNKIGDCGSRAFNPDTCWNDVLKTFVTTLPNLPANSLIYGYYSYSNGASYNLCSIMETAYNIVPALPAFIGCTQVCLDFDGDGYGLAGSTLCPFPQADCDDSNKFVHPGMTEICGDGIDQNCSGFDLPCPSTCLDVDGDGFDACDQFNPNGNGTLFDCDDNNPSIYPGALEVCDGIDNNCSGGTDEGCDVDNDNYCSCSASYIVGVPIATCSNTDTSSATSFNASCDCNDTNQAINPGVTEVCDGLDNNCKLGTDEGCDTDGDDYCDCSMNIIVGSSLGLTCSNTITLNPTWIATTCDCDDNNSSIWNTCGTPSGCITASDCDDLNECTHNICSSGVCSNPFISNGTTCADGTCNGSGICIPTTPPPPPGCTNASDCDDLNECTHNICSSGVCSNPFISNGTTCSGGTCNGSGACISTTPPPPPVCGDGTCNGTETNLTCPGDCPAPPPPPPVCGDGTCNGTETNLTCPGDCPLPVCTFPITFPCTF